MDDLLKEFDTYRAIALFALLALPGFISIQVWRLLVPATERNLKDIIPEALAFGLLNAAVGAPPVLLFAATPGQAYGFAFLVLVVLPTLWPFAVRSALERLERANLILNRARTGWDAAFLRREPYFVIVHLKDGRRIGGYYGTDSYAGLHPCSGHLYLEQTWTLDASGRFVTPVADSRGLVLRPDDYHFVELFSPGQEAKNV
ncbi:DUF6338 family protein [Blastochloris viridis]|uniref:Uncharacterized protein n=1 Tax=Blastochloris viridis TaxID=1079 RepID=A0A0H5BCM3_BLAVI|nr:DUF6338 family protein [Blastochloris viridis]ALK07873.1 hypothetical protein BVIR_56 [Blastochloris viridis]BAR98879.1 hypothetical protein BV133_1286 [Blastochloris viridis]CUU43795.1 hypothetical protein BVIRIDIS_28220 [Blastochloris viridis]